MHRDSCSPPRMNSDHPLLRPLRTAALAAGLLSAATVQAWWQQYPADGWDLQALVNAAAANDLCQGVHLSADWHGDLTVPAAFAQSPLHDRAIEVLGPWPLRIARSVTFAGPLTWEDAPFRARVIGGWIGTEAGELPLGPAVVVEAYPVTFEGVEFRRWIERENEGDLLDPDCVIRGDHELVSVAGLSGGQELHHDPAFSWVVGRAADFIDCSFVTDQSGYGDGCQAALPVSPLLVAEDTRLRVANPCIDSNAPFRLSPIGTMGSLVHLEHGTVGALAGEGDGGLLAMDGGSGPGAVPALYLNGLVIEGCTGRLAGAVSATGLSAVQLVDAVFTGCSATGPSHAGPAGALRLTGCGPVEVAGGEFADNASASSGALRVTGSTAGAGQRALWVEPGPDGSATRFAWNAGGGDQAGALFVEGGVNPLLEGTVFEGNDTGLRLVGCGPDPAGTVQGLQRCTFSGNGTGLIAQGGTLRLDGCELQGNGTGGLAAMGATDGGWQVTNCRFLGNDIGLRVEGVGRAGDRIRNNLFIGHARAVVFGEMGWGEGSSGWVDGNTFLGSYYSSLHFEAQQQSVQVVNNIFWRADGGFEITYGPPYDLPFVTVRHNTLNGGVMAIESWVADIDPATTWSVDPELLVDPARGWDHELRWNHWLVDRGAATGTGDFLAHDFDLTPRDIGWRPFVEPAELSSLAGGLPRGYYEVTDHRALSAPGLSVAAGTVIRVAGGKDFDLWSSSGGFPIGDLDGPRTAFVGRVPGIAGNARSIDLGDPNAPQAASLGGVLFKYAPTQKLGFSGLDGLLLDPSGQHGATVVFRNLGGAKLQLHHCTGAEVRKVDFVVQDPYTNPDQENPEDLLILFGQVDVHHCEFINDNDPFPTARAELTLAMSLNSTVRDNVFHPSTATDYPLRLSGGSVYLKRNLFTGLDRQAVWAVSAAVHAAKNAGNEFLAAEPSGTSQSLIHLSSGSLDLDCGYNRFVNGQAIQNTPFVTYSGAPQAVSWRKNFWGYSVTDPVDCDDIHALVPAWADASNCLAEYDPPIYFCPLGMQEDQELWDAGQQAEGLGRVDEAIWYYSELLRLYPKSPWAPYAADRLKALGKSGGAGARAGLEAGAAVAEAEGEAWLAASQTAAAACLQALEGDREGALETLDELAEAGEAAAVCAALAALEIDTYAGAGGLAMAGDPVARRAAAREAVEALLAFDPSTLQRTWSEGAAVPATFQLVSVYPNPFNPVATIEFELPRDGRWRVTLHNLLGQTVRTLAEGPVAAGRQRLTLDGSGMASGVYLVRAEGFGSVVQRKVTLLK
jgi:hypothetical protein